MRLFFELFAFLLLFIELSYGWDQIVTPSFKEIFPAIEDEKVWSLTFHVNRQKSTGDAKKYLNEWIDENWQESLGSIIVTDSEVMVTTTENPRISEEIDYEVNDGSGDLYYSGDSDFLEYEASGDSDSEDFDYSGDSEDFDSSGDFWNHDLEDSEGSGDLGYEYSGSGDYEDWLSQDKFSDQIEYPEVTTSSEDLKQSESLPVHPFLTQFNVSDTLPIFEDSEDTNDTDEFENFLMVCYFEGNSTSMGNSEKFQKFKRASGGFGEQKWEAEWFKYDTTTPPPWKKRCLTDKEYARNQALSFLDHRDTLKMYIRYIFKMGQMDGLITKIEAEKMRQIFWKNDKFYKNKFSRAEYGFVTEVVKNNEWIKPSSKIASSLQMYAAHWDKFPPIAEKLNWVVQEDYFCWYDNAKYNW